MKGKSPLRVDPPDDSRWLNVQQNIEVHGDMKCPKCNKLMAPLWYTDKLIDPHSGEMKHKLYGYCDEHGMFTKTWFTNSDNRP